MYFQQGAKADINILMGAALTFIKEGSRHISAGVDDGTLRGNEWRGMLPVQASVSCHVRGVRGDQMFSLGPCSSSHPKHWFWCGPSTRRLALWFVKNFAFLVSIYWCLSLFPSPLHSGFHLSLADRPTGFYIIHELHIVFWMMQDACFHSCATYKLCGKASSTI